MAHESFENEEIAAILNQNFISVKVDREERPDIDSVYMEVCQTPDRQRGMAYEYFYDGRAEALLRGNVFSACEPLWHDGISGTVTGDQ